MSYEDYKRLRKEQDKALKAYNRGVGRLVFCSARLLDVIPNPNFDPDKPPTSEEDIKKGYSNDNPPNITVLHDPKRKDRIRVIKETAKQGYTKRDDFDAAEYLRDKYPNAPDHTRIRSKAVEVLKAEVGKYFDDHEPKTV